MWLWFGSLVSETNVSVCRVLNEFGSEAQLSHALCDIEFLLITAQTSDFVLFLVGIECEFPIVDVQLLEQAWEQDLSVHLLPKFNSTVGHKNLHTLIVESTGFTAVHHKHRRDTVKCGNTITNFITHSNVLHFFQRVHEFNPIDTPTPGG